MSTGETGYSDIIVIFQRDGRIQNLLFAHRFSQKTKILIAMWHYSERDLSTGRFQSVTQKLATVIQKFVYCKLQIAGESEKCCS